MSDGDLTEFTTVEVAYPFLDLSGADIEFWEDPEEDED